MEEVHCHPNNDERRHSLTQDCACEPLVEWLDPDTGLPWASGMIRVIHNAFDCREFAEELDERSMAPEKDWIVEIVESAETSP